MPNLTDRAQQLQDLHGLLLLGVLSEPAGCCSSGSSTSSSSSDEHTSDSDSSEPDEEESLKELAGFYHIAEGMRYFEDRGKFLKSKEFATNFFNTLPDAYFRHVTRMRKATFWMLVGMIKANPIFHNRGPREQVAVSLQLAATLDRLGHYGNGAALKRSGILWGISTGSIIKFMHRCMRVLEVALADAFTWPDRDERARISTEFAKKGFPGCVGLVDGTTLPLSQRPKIDGEVYFDRKKRYSVNMQVICDDRRKMLHMFAGMPGSCSDLNCFQSSPLWRFRDHPDTFSNGQYLLSDCAYPNLPYVVAAFKHIQTRNNQDREDFNFCVAKTRVTNEHCIGVLKSRWHSLKELKTQLKEPDTSVWMIRQIECCARLHNFVIDQQDEWDEEEYGVTEIEDEADTPAAVNESNSNSIVWREKVMASCLAINRAPGGFLA